MEIFDISRSKRKVILNFYLRLLVLRFCRKVWAYEYPLFKATSIKSYIYTSFEHSLKVTHARSWPQCHFVGCHVEDTTPMWSHCHLNCYVRCEKVLNIFHIALFTPIRRATWIMYSHLHMWVTTKEPKDFFTFYLYPGGGGRGAHLHDRNFNRQCSFFPHNWVTHFEIILFQ